jgi:putative membrane protein
MAYSQAFPDGRAAELAPAPGAASAADVPVAASLIRAAKICLALHAALSIFSAAAFATFLSGPPPAWLQEPSSQRALQIGWTFGPATTVVLGALAGLLHAAGRLGRRRALLIFVFGFGISLASELSGTGTGYPFGAYSYSGLLGYKIGGLVPFNIPTSWFFMLYCSLAICGRVLAVRDDARSKAKWAVVAGLVLTAWDVSMDPAMVRTAHWIWHLAPVAEQTPLQRIFVSDIFYGMPLSNWLGWLLTGTVVARVMLAIVPPSTWARLVSPSRFPLALYAVNGILPITICARYGMWWAALLGFLAMAIPLVLAMRAPQRARAPRSALAPFRDDVSAERGARMERGAAAS